MELIDVTLQLDEGLPRFPGDPPFVRWRYRTLDEGHYEASVFHLGAHAGTHVDAPRHFVRGGTDAADLAIEILCGTARVLDLRSAGPAISAATLRAADFEGTQRVLLRTLPGTDLAAELTAPGAYLTPDAARYLIDETDVRLIGMDRLSVEADTAAEFPVHNLLASAELVILEGLDLRGVPPGEYTLYCLPLRIAEAEAAPARVLLHPLG
jgi:arylformamidase